MTRHPKAWILAFALVLPFLVMVPAAQEQPLSVLQAERAKFGAQIDTVQAGALLDAAAARLGDGWGLLRKTGGNRCPQPGTGIDVSCDWLVNQRTGLGCDALGSGPDNENGGHAGPATPQWCAGEPFDKNAWVKPSGNVTVPPPPPPPPDTEVMKLLVEMESHQRELLTKIDALSQLLATVHGDTWATNAEVFGIRDKLDAPVIFPVYKGRVLGQPFTLTPQK